MRSRLVIPAAILVAVAYVKGRQDAQLFAAAARPATPAPPAPPVPGPTQERILRAQAEAADAWEAGLEELADADLAAAEAAAALAEAPVVEAPVFEDLLIEDEEDEEPATLWSPGADAVLVPEAAPSVVTSRGSAWEPDPVALSEWFGTPAGAAASVEASGRFALGGWAAQAGHMTLCGVTFPAPLADAVEAGRVRLVPDVLQNVTASGLVVLGDAGFAPDAEGFTLLVAASAPGPFAASGRYELIAGSAG